MKAAFLVAMAAALSGCGLLYTNVRLPRAYRSAAPSEVKGSSEDRIVHGEACNRSILYLIAWGDGGYAAATRAALKEEPNGLLYDVKADIHGTTILLGLYSRTCTVVTGKVAKP